MLNLHIQFVTSQQVLSVESNLCREEESTLIKPLCKTRTQRNSIYNRHCDWTSLDHLDLSVRFEKQ